MAADWDIGNFDITLKALTGDGAIQGASLTDGTLNITGGEILDATTLEATTTLGIEIGDVQQLVLTDGKLNPTTDNDIDLGDATHEFKDAFFDGTVTSDAFAGPLTGAVTGAASGNLLNSESDTLIGTLTADGLTLGQDENITLAGQTLDHDGTDFVFNDSVNIGANALTTSVPIKSEPKNMIFTLYNPLAMQTDDTQVLIWRSTPAALTITNIKISLDAAGNEIAGDLMFADAFIGFANATVINVCDTTSGVLDDRTMADGTVPAGKDIYFQYDSPPDTAITQMGWNISWNYD